MVIFSLILWIIYWSCFRNSFSHFWNNGTEGSVQKVGHRQSLHKNVDFPVSFSIATASIFALSHKVAKTQGLRYKETLVKTCLINYYFEVFLAYGNCRAPSTLHSHLATAFYFGVFRVRCSLTVLNLYL